MLTHSHSAGAIAPASLYLFPLDDTWHVATVGGDAPMLIELFGTAILPTPYTTSVHGEHVATQLKRLNPTAKVEWFASQDAFAESGVYAGVTR